MVRSKGRNRVILFVNEDDILSLIIQLSGARQSGHFTVWDMKPIPSDALLCGVYYVPEQQGFQLVLEHESFPATTPGSRLFEIGPSHAEYIIKIDWDATPPTGKAEAANEQAE